MNASRFSDCFSTKFTDKMTKMLKKPKFLKEYSDILAKNSVFDKNIEKKLDNYVKALVNLGETCIFATLKI